MAKRRKSAISWFAVKTLYRTTPVGRPVARDSAYDPWVTMLEERVVLFRARSFDAAIRVAEKEARSYALHRCVNPYGQEVVTRYLRALDAFELFSPPGPGVEVFSTTEIVSKRIRDDTLIDRRMGLRVDRRADRKRRRNILNREFSGSVMPAKRRPPEA